MMPRYASSRLKAIGSRRLNAKSRVQSRDNALPCGLFIAGCAIDLTGEKQARNAVGLERRPKLSGLDEVVFDCVSRSQHLGGFESW